MIVGHHTWHCIAITKYCSCECTSFCGHIERATHLPCLGIQDLSTAINRSFMRRIGVYCWTSKSILLPTTSRTPAYKTQLYSQVRISFCRECPCHSPRTHAIFSVWSAFHNKQHPPSCTVSVPHRIPLADGMGAFALKVELLYEMLRYCNMGDLV